MVEALRKGLQESRFDLTVYCIIASGLGSHNSSNIWNVGLLNQNTEKAEEELGIPGLCIYSEK